MVRPKDMIAEVGPELESALISYSAAAASVILQSGRLAGLSEKTAMELATSQIAIDTIAMNLYTLTNQSIVMIQEKFKNMKGDPNANI